MLDNLNNLLFIRRWKGGIWYRITRLQSPIMVYIWTQHPLQSDMILLNQVFFNGNDQSCFIFCPYCGIELITGGEYIGNSVPSNLVKYCCNRCHTTSIWDFDPPAPILIEYKVKQITGVMD